MTDDALEPTGAPGGFDLEFAVSELASNAADVSMLLRLLVEQLGPALGGRLSVERQGGLLRRSGDVKALQVALGDDVLRAEVDGGVLRCTIGHSSGGIRIRSERVEVASWLRRLLGTLSTEAARSEEARRALENMMIGGTQ